MRSSRLAATALTLALTVPGMPVAQGFAGECSATYTVRQGDTLYSIAARCGRSFEALLEANPGLADPGRISIGQELTIPDDGSQVEAGAPAEPGSPAAPAAGTYTVEPGDSMAGIASRLGLPLDDLLAANEAVDPRALQPGQELVLPAASAESGGESSGAAGKSAAASGETATAGSDDLAGQDAPAEEKPGRPEPAPERLALEGRIQNGPECPVLRTPDGELYSLVSQSYGFTPGDYVTIEGEPVEMSFCSQHNTVRVTSMTAKPAPRGG